MSREAGSLRFRPALVDALRGYDRGRLAKDLVAGAIVGVVAIPLALAFAIASGVEPGAGLATAVVAGFIVSALGGSRVQVAGPTGAFVVIVHGVVTEHGVDGLALATVMAGVILVLFGLFRAGRIIEFIPSPVIVGFTAGIGAIIFIGQLREVLGLGHVDLPSETLAKVAALGRHAGEANPWSVSLALGTMATIVAVKRFVPRIPGPVVALAAFTGAAFAFDLPVETIGDRFGTLPSGLPMPGLPEVSLQRIRELLPSALTIALLGAIESLLSAVVADAMTDGRHDSNQELMAQGLANLASPLFGGIPATGAIARTATNVQNGATSPVAGMTHAAVVLLTVVALTSWLGHVPLAVLGGILIVVAFYMSDVPRLRQIGRMPRADAAVLVATLVLTVLVDLVVAVEVGMVLASFLFMLRMSQVANVEAIGPAGAGEDTLAPVAQRPMDELAIPEGVVVYSVDGPFFFGAAERFQRVLARIEGHPRVVVFRMRNVPYVDATGLAVLEGIVKSFRRHGTAVVLSAVQQGPFRAMRRSGLVDLVGEENVLPGIDLALARARRIVAGE